MLKQVIVVRKDLNMSCGKIAAQVAHASLEAYLISDEKLRNMWRIEGAKKIVLKVDNLEQLEEIYNRAEAMGIRIVKIVDAGYTELDPGTVTCIGAGPDFEDRLNKVFGSLKLL
ncbi:MAG: peptidyl-tRNA hydrolase Pth2 [Candidatus Anstonellales archaeon]